jgi:ketosteroid isomerase-like protein
MSQENVEVVKSIFRGWDEARVDGMLPFFHEDIEYLPTEEAGTIHGHDALRRYFERTRDCQGGRHVAAAVPGDEQKT